MNPNKALHIGHARNLVLGDSLVRTMKRLGHEVQTLNYIDDSGAQVADVIVGLKFLKFSDQAPAGVKFDAYCGDVVYTKVNQMYEKDPSLKEKQRLVLKEIEKGSGEISEYAEKVVSQNPRRPAADVLALGRALRPPELGVPHPEDGDVEGGLRGAQEEGDRRARDTRGRTPDAGWSRTQSSGKTRSSSGRTGRSSTWRRTSRTRRGR